jgi:acid phosphatase
VPLLTSQEEGDVRSVRQGLLPNLEQSKVDLVLAGHKHRYERSKLGRTVHVLSGGGGADLSPVDHKDKDVDAVEKKHHFLSLTIGPKSIRGRAVEPDGHVLDEFKVD